MKSLNIYLYTCIVVILSFSCENTDSYSTISSDSMLSMKVKQMMGDNVDPYTSSSFDYVGFPGAIAYADELENYPFILLGKRLKKGRKYLSLYFAEIECNIGGIDRRFGIAVPSSTAFRTFEVNSFESFTTEYAMVKLWITDWFSNAYRGAAIHSIKWNNESDIYRQLQLLEK